MINKNTLDEPIKAVKEEGNHKEGSVTYTHPSYGMVSISRQTCSGDGLPLFGAKHPSSTVMSLTIELAQNNQHLSRNWYYGKETITEILMTPVQYAELISNPNTQGVPCTIKYTQSEGNIIYKPHATEVEYLDVQIKDSLDDLKGNLKANKDRATELLSQKGTLKKADKEELLKLFLNIDTDMQSTIPWYKEQMEKSLEGMVMEANSDIESLVANVQTKLGKKLLDNPKALEAILNDEGLLLESK